MCSFPFGWYQKARGFCVRGLGVSELSKPRCLRSVHSTRWVACACLRHFLVGEYTSCLTTSDTVILTSRLPEASVVLKKHVLGKLFSWVTPSRTAGHIRYPRKSHPSRQFLGVKTRHAARGVDVEELRADNDELRRQNAELEAKVGSQEVKVSHGKDTKHQTQCSVDPRTPGPPDLPRLQALSFTRFLLARNEGIATSS